MILILDNSMCAGVDSAHKSKGALGFPGAPFRILKEVTDNGCNYSEHIE